MAKKRVKRIELEKFRGATTETQIEFDDAKPIVVIFGENGSGKSTIGNALDFVCNKSKGSLETLSSTRFSDTVSIGNDAKDLKVRIHQGSSMWEGSQDGNTIQVNPVDDIPNVLTLRRNKLLRLVEATPEKRFDTIRSFIDFEKLESSEQKLRDASRRADKSVEDYSRLHTQAKATLDTAWTNDGRPGESSTDWAVAKVAVDVTESRETAASCDAALRSIEIFETDVKAVAFTKGEFEHAEAELGTVEAEIAAQQSEPGQSDVKLVEMLASVSSIIADPYDRNECPACLTEFDLGTLRADVRERIAALKNASKLSMEHKLKTAGVETKRSLSERSSTKLGESVRALKDLVPQGMRANAEPQAVTDRLDAFDFDAEAFSEANIIELSAIVDDAKPLLATKRDAINRDLNLYDTVRRDLDLVDRTLADVEAEDSIAKRLKKALEIVHGTRIKATQDILDAVFDDFLRYWEAIHPGEPLKPTKLSLSETAKGSLSQVGSFCGHDEISPQAYFSESHLDTLGFCYWLAIAKYSTDGDAVIVLDDVFTSVDNEHLGRIIDLLVEESETFNQILLFTHQRRWHDAFRFGAKAQGKVHVVELGMWDLATGIVTYPTRMEVEKLAELLKVGPLDRQAVCGKAGVLLEQAFDELTKQYKCSMPRAPRDEYTLNAYAGTTSGLFKKLKVIRPDGSGGTEEIDLLPYHTELSPFVSVRNQVGAHFNLTAAEFVDREIVRFGNLTVDLISTLLCRNCRGLANRMDKATGKWNCECKQTQMLPNSL